jgi:uncharacterized protein (UPF0332 family)
VTPEAARHLDKARHVLAGARRILDADVPDSAGREAYLAAFHAAPALIAARTGRTPKTHRGTHVEFARLSREEPAIDAELRRFLPQSYDIKSVADYETGPDAVVPVEEAAAAIETAERFIACIAGLLE